MIFQVNQLATLEGELIRMVAIFPDEIVIIRVNGNQTSETCSKHLFYQKFALEGILDFKDYPYGYIDNHHLHASPEDMRKAKDNFNLIEPLLEDINIFDHKKRNKLIKARAKEVGSSQSHVSKQLKRYWKRGMCLNALLPDTHLKGGPGIPKPKDGKKLGRNRKGAEEGEKQGVNTCDKVRNLFIQAIKLIRERKSSTRTLNGSDDKLPSLSKAHDYLTLIFGDAFPEVPVRDYPTYHSFSRFYYREYPQGKRLRAIKNPVNFFNNNQELTATVNMHTLGPGGRYQIDATPWDIRLASTIDRRVPLIKATLITVVDVWSRMIVGFHLSLDNSSKATTALALKSAIMDKVEFCASLGVNIDTEEWPCSGTCQFLATDRAKEYLSKFLDNAIIEQYFGVENNTARKSRYNSIAEQTFRNIYRVLKPLLPGVVYTTNSKKAGGGDAALEARINMEEMNKILIDTVLYLNNDRVIEEYDPEFDLDSDVPYTPLDLWNWGIENRASRLKQVNPDNFYCSLLPTKSVSVSDEGINFFGMYYKPITETDWFLRGPGVKRPKGLSVSYSELDISVIYLHPAKGEKDFIPLELTGKCRQFEGLSLEAAKSKKAKRTYTNTNKKQKTAIKRGKYQQKIEEIVLRAKEKYDELSSQSDAERKGKMDEYSKAEKVKQNTNRHDWNGVNGEVAVKVDNECQPDENDDLLSMM